MKGNILFSDRKTPLGFRKVRGSRIGTRVVCSLPPDCVIRSPLSSPYATRSVSISWQVVVFRMREMALQAVQGLDGGVRTEAMRDIDM